MIGEFVLVEKGEGAIDCFPHQCSFCHDKFRTKSALGAHQVHCQRKKEQESKVDFTSSEKEKSCIFVLAPSEKPHTKRCRKEKDARSSKSIYVGRSDSGGDAVVKDKRVNNRGAAVRRRYSAREKVDFVDKVNEFINDVSNSSVSVASYFRGVLKCRESEVQSMCNTYYKWGKKEEYENNLRVILNMPKNAKGRRRVTNSNKKSPYHDMESELYSKFVTMRRSGRKVSASYIRIEGKKIFDRLKSENPAKWMGMEFKGTYGWMRRFIKRKNIKFRKRKCGKEKTAEECVEAFEDFLERVRFDFLNPRDGDGDLMRESIWGRFPPELRYNMDQVPLPFVNGQDETFTMEDDDVVNLKCPKESLRKRQFTMHLVFNAGTGDKGHGWCDLVCRGTGRRISMGERELWHEDVRVFWQKKAWVDKYVIRDLAVRFVDFKIQKHGVEKWVILFCDNLSAHLDEEVKLIFGNGKVFLCYFPPNMTNMVQPIDAGLGRSVRIKIGHALDEWLMEEENLEKWESKMSASERRIVTTQFIGKAMNEVMSTENTEMRRRAFEKTGCLITWLPIATHDDKICPQGLEKGMFHVPTTRTLVDQGDTDSAQVPMENEQAGVIEEQVLIDENEEVGFLHFDDEEDNGSEIDDNPEL